MNTNIWKNNWDLKTLRYYLEQDVFDKCKQKVLSIHYKTSGADKYFICKTKIGNRAYRFLDKVDGTLILRPHKDEYFLIKPLTNQK